MGFGGLKKLKLAPTPNEPGANLAPERREETPV